MRISINTNSIEIFLVFDFTENVENEFISLEMEYTKSQGGGEIWENEMKEFEGLKDSDVSEFGCIYSSEIACVHRPLLVQSLKVKGSRKTSSSSIELNLYKNTIPKVHCLVYSPPSSALTCQNNCVHLLSCTPSFHHCHSLSFSFSKENIFKALKLLVNSFHHFLSHFSLFPFSTLSFNIDLHSINDRFNAIN